MTNPCYEASRNIMAMCYYSQLPAVHSNMARSVTRSYPDNVFIPAAGSRPYFAPVVISRPCRSS